jgi:hypothetical protein
MIDDIGGDNISMLENLSRSRIILPIVFAALFDMLIYLPIPLGLIYFSDLFETSEKILICVSAFLLLLLIHFFALLFLTCLKLRNGVIDAETINKMTFWGRVKFVTNRISPL